MRSSILLTFLASTGYVVSVPVAEAEPNLRVDIGSPLVHDAEVDFAVPLGSRLKERDSQKKKHQNRQFIRTTRAPVNPPTPSTRTTTTTRTTTRTTTTTTTRAATTTTSGPKPVQTINVTGMTYINAMLTAHNVHRANHSEANLVWDQRLADIATTIAQTCVYQHDTTTGGGGYGQNIGAGSAGNAAAGLINNLMYNGEINNYPQPYGVNNVDMSTFGSWGHYSQLVWSDTTNVGCSTVYCPGGLRNTGSNVPPYFTVCNYTPPGNYVGQFAKVKPPQGGATVVIVGT